MVCIERVYKSRWIILGALDKKFLTDAAAVVGCGMNYARDQKTEKIK